jgi:hypothetical protein
MPRAYAEDLRIRVVRAVDGGMSARQAARAFAVAASTEARLDLDPGIRTSGLVGGAPFRRARRSG